MKLFGIAALTIAVLGCAAGTASASSITYSLNCTLTGPPAVCTAGGPFGSVTLSDDASANDIDITVSLLNGTQTVNFIALNWSGATVPATGWSATTGSGTVTVTPGNNATGPFLNFDLRVDPSGNFNPLTLRLSNSAFGNLDPSMFDVKDPVLNAVYLDVNTGAGTAEIRYGSTAHDVSAGTTATTVPEPATLALVGIGAMLAASRLRRRQ
jgi:hypothetical protein